MTVRTVGATLPTLPGRRRVGGTVLDNFDRANGAVTAAPMTTGQTWTVPAGGWNISSNVATPTSAGAANVMYIDFGSANHEVSCYVTKNGTTSGPICRGTNATDFYWLRHNTSTVDLYRRSGGGGSFTLMSSVTFSMTTSVVYKFTLKAFGASIIGLIDDVPLVFTPVTFNAAHSIVGAWGEDAASVVNNWTCHLLDTNGNRI